MRNDIKLILANKGYDCIFESIRKSINDLKHAGYTRGEIKETILDIFSDNGSVIDEFIYLNL